MRVQFVPVVLAVLLAGCGDGTTTSAEEDAASDVSGGEETADSGTSATDGAVPDATGADSADLEASSESGAPDSGALDTRAPGDARGETFVPTPGCVAKGGFCTWAGASRCCSGSCDGDSCNGYPLGHACSSNTQCQLNNCVAGVCACAIGDAQCGAAGVCVDLEYNDAHCGACGKACGPNQRCLAGKCECTQTYLTDCGGDCYDTRVEEAHCGACGKACRADQVCASSACRCTTGTECNGACLFFGSDPNNCGSCGNVCPSDHPRCSGSACVCAAGLTQCPTGCKDLLTDRTNCQTCGTTCAGMKQCVNGACQ